MDKVTEMLTHIGSYVMGLPFVVLIISTGIFFSVRLLLPQVRKLGHGVAITLGYYDRPEHEGDISHFQALCAALSATVGVGNIAGVATAIHAGGPGALFWMWVSGFFGMTLKCAECTLAQKYRVIHKDGSVSGGPMYYIEKGLGPRFKWLACIFAFCCMVATFGGGNMVQSNSMTIAIVDHFAVQDRFLWRAVIGLFISFTIGLVIIGGIKRIGRVAGKLVPFMCATYVSGALIIIFFNYDRIPETFYLIFKHAFTPTSAVGGFAGATVLYTITWGVKRAVFSNEAGVGSAPIAHAAARTNEPVREGLVGLLEPFVDTIIVCTMTGFVIILTGSWQSGADSSILTKNAFETGLPVFGGIVVTMGLVLFAVSTAISWSYYGDRCALYLFGPGAVMPYRWIFVVALFVGAMTQINFVWGFSDITFGLMAFPNLIAIIALSDNVVALSRDYFSRRHERTK
ncbi:MAG: sodium:alanine symporter family protein [Candidatus Brocadiales bacterium]|nr:sodium:alanine symporter family protein [Candidatus Brocadiales bacterium]